MAAYLVPPNDAAALAVAKRAEFNYLKYRIKLMEDATILPKIKDALEKRDIDPRDLTLDQLYKIQDRVRMYGFKKGILNTKDGYTTSYFERTPVRRLTDNKVVFPLPEKPAYRAKLLEGLPNWEDYVEEAQADWFPTDEDEPIVIPE